LIFYIPQLCTEGSFMGEMVEKYGVGCSINPYSETLADDIYYKYSSIDFNELIENCDKEYSRVTLETTEGLKMIKNVLNNT